MKIAAALLIPIVGVTAQLAPLISSVDGRAQGGSCRDVSGVKIDLTKDALTLGLTDYWPNSNDTISPDGTRNSGWGYCRLDLSVIPRSPGWRWRIKDATYTGSAKAYGGGEVDIMYTRVWQEYIQRKEGSYEVAQRRDYKGQNVQYEARPTDIGPDSDYDSTFSYTGGTTDKLERWSPCVGDDWNDSLDEFKLTFTHQVYTFYKSEKGQATSYAEVGRPNGQSDVVVKLNLEWEQCDAAKADFRNTWAEKRE